MDRRRYLLHVWIRTRLKNGGTPSRAASLSLIFAAWLIPSLLSGFNSFMQDRLSGRPSDWHWITFSSLDWLLYAVLTPFVFRMSRRFPLVREHLSRTILFHIAASLAMCVAWAGLGTILRWIIFPITRDASIHTYLQSWLSWTFTTLPFGVGVYFALVGIEHSLHYFREARDREAQASQLTAQLSEARLSALRMQLNPHFLFNSLNAITVLVRDRDMVGASRTLELLSDVLRQVLRSDAKHEITLAEEFDFLARYLAIEQIRFSDRLRCRIEADPAISRALVPTFLLQPLVENAIRHGIASRADGGTIEVSSRREDATLVLTIRDDGKGALGSTGARSTSGGGLGLANTRARLATLYGENASLETTVGKGGGFTATVRIPFREEIV
jgi:two-component system, LytTR family, sensor kinase